MILDYIILPVSKQQFFENLRALFIILPVSKQQFFENLHAFFITFPVSKQQFLENVHVLVIILPVSKQQFFENLHVLFIILPVSKQQFFENLHVLFCSTNSSHPKRFWKEAVLKVSESSVSKVKPNSVTDFFHGLFPCELLIAIWFDLRMYSLLDDFENIPTWFNLKHAII